VRTILKPDTLRVKGFRPDIPSDGRVGLLQPDDEFAGPIHAFTRWLHSTKDLDSRGAAEARRELHRRGIDVDLVPLPIGGRS